MDGIEIKNGKIRVSLNGQRWTVAGNATKTHINQVSRLRTQLKNRLNYGEYFDDLLLEIFGKGKEKQSETLGYFAQHFFDIVAPEHIADSTLRGYLSAYNTHWLGFDNKPIHKLKLTELQRHLAKKSLTKKTQKNVISVLSMIIDCAVPQTIPINILTPWRVKRSKSDEEQKPDPYSANERDQLLFQLKNQDYASWRYFNHGFGSGMRTGELLGSEYQHYEKPFFIVNQEVVRRKLEHYTKTTKSGDEGRRLILAKFTMNMLDDTGTGFIHTNTQGNMCRDADYFMKHWKLAHEATGIRQRKKLYPWRSTYITMLVDGGMKPVDVAAFSGNSIEMIQKHYYKRIENLDRDVLLVKEVHKALGMPGGKVRVVK